MEGSVIRGKLVFFLIIKELHGYLYMYKLYVTDCMT